MDFELISSAQQRKLIDQKAQLKTFSGPYWWNMREVFKVHPGNSIVVRCQNAYIHPRITQILFGGQHHCDLHPLEGFDYLRAQWMNADVVDNETWGFYLREFSSNNLC